LERREGRGTCPGVSSVSHLIHGQFFVIGEMLDMNKRTELFITFGALLLVFVVAAFII
jgi:hypothetical protein